jgi:hypothetical protein
MKDCSVYKTKLTMSAHRRLDPVASGERWHTHVVSVRRGIALSGFKAAPPHSAWRRCATPRFERE